MKPWAKWLVNHNMKFILYVIWFVILPVYFLRYTNKVLEDSMKDALSDFEDIATEAKQG